MTFQKISLLIFMLALSFTVNPSPRNVTIGLVSDGPGQRQILPVAILRQEVDALLTGEFRPGFPKAKQLDGNWSISGIQQAINRQMNDPSIDIIVTMGWISSNEAAKIKNPRKPIIAAFGGDSELQGFPLQEGTSGRRNFVYLYDFKSIQQNLATFQQLQDFQRLSILVDPLWLDSVPGLEKKLQLFVQKQKPSFDFSLIPAVNKVDRILKKLPDQPVYITPLLHLNKKSMLALAQGLIDKGLPSFSEIGKADLQLGILAGQSGGTDDEVRRARRIANIMLRILTGTNAGDIKVGYNEQGRKMINMRTAKSMGLDFSWRTLDDAELLFAEQAIKTGIPISLNQSMELALQNNLDLQSISVNSAIALEEIGISRSTLLPQIEIDAGYRQIDRDRGSPTGLAQGNGTAGVNLSQEIYSDRSWADYTISKLNKTAVDYRIKARALDTLQISASSYLALLQARAQEIVQRSNLDLTRNHLKLARLRERIGTAGRAEVLRWNSEIARNKQVLLDFQARTRQTTTSLNQVLNQPVIEAIDTSDPNVESLLAFMSKPQMLNNFENPKAWQNLQRYYLQKSVDNAPELGFFQPRMAAQERDILANKRSYYIPDITFNGRYQRDLGRNGAGSDLSGTGLDRDAWIVGVQATLPLFSGGRRQSRLSRSEYQLQQLKVNKSSVRLRIKSSMATALQKVEASFPSITLTRTAETNAKENLKLVTDQYSRGSVSITQLIDAQNAALVARLDASVARYSFLIDLVEVLRASADFSLILDPAGKQNLLSQLAAYREN